MEFYIFRYGLLFVLGFFGIFSIVWQVFPATVLDLHLYIKNHVNKTMDFG